MTHLRLMFVFAHPDDESMGAGAIIAKYVAESVDVYLLCATRERGWQGDEKIIPTRRVGEDRTEELMNAAKVLGLREVNFLDYIDGDLDKAIMLKRSTKLRLTSAAFSRRWLSPLVPMAHTDTPITSPSPNSLQPPSCAPPIPVIPIHLTNLLIASPNYITKWIQKLLWSCCTRGVSISLLTWTV